MSKMFYHVMQDNVGNLLFGVSGTMRIAGSGTLATIYGDEALTVILPNPMTNHPSFGSFKCFLGVGDYDFYMAKAGYTFETLTGVQGSGTMADQNASAVAITGGTITAGDIVGSRVGVNAAIGSDAAGTLRVGASAIVGNNLSVAGTSTFTAATGHGRAPELNASLTVQVLKAGTNGMFFRQDADAGSALTMVFHNAAGTVVGSINSTGAATAFNTTSDARLKHDVDDLVGELAVIQALRPVSFFWNADDTPGVGFLAVEVAAVLAGVITGEEGALDEAGGILPQMIDYSKLVPFLTGAIKTLAAQVTALDARVHVLEDALGV